MGQLQLETQQQSQTYKKEIAISGKINEGLLVKKDINIFYLGEALKSSPPSGSQMFFISGLHF